MRDIFSDLPLRRRRAYQKRRYGYATRALWHCDNCAALESGRGGLMGSQPCHTVRGAAGGLSPLPRALGRSSFAATPPISIGGVQEDRN